MREVEGIESFQLLPKTAEAEGERDPPAQEGPAPGTWGTCPLGEAVRLEGAEEVFHN